VSFFQALLGLVGAVFHAVDNSIKSAAASVGGEGVLAGLVLAVMALIAAGNASDRIEELTEKIEELEEKVEELEGNEEEEADSW